MVVQIKNVLKNIKVLDANFLMFGYKTTLFLIRFNANEKTMMYLVEQIIRMKHS